GVRAAWLGVDDIPLFPFSPYPGTTLYDELRRDGRVPPPDDDYFAGLGYMDMAATSSVSRHIGARELSLYCVLGMSAFYAISYLRHPRRVLRTVRNVLTERSETVLEQRLVEYRHRWARRPAAAANGFGAPALPHDLAR